MGTSTDAILALGVDLGDVDALDDHTLWKSGFPPHDKCEFDDWFDDYFVPLTEKKDSPVELVFHCSVEHPMVIAAVKEHVFRAWRGYPSTIHPVLTLTPDEDDVRAFEAWMTGQGFKAVKPRWLLASNWG